DLRVGHPAIVDGRAFRRRGEFTKDVVRDDVREILFGSEPVCEIDENLPIHSGIARRCDRLLQPDAAAFSGGYRTFVLFLQRSRQHHIRMTGRFGQKEINAPEKFQLLQRGSRTIRVRYGSQRIETDRQETSYLSGFNGVEDLAGGEPGVGKFGLGDTPEL